MIPIHKTGKDKTKADSYRPMRLMWHLEEKQLLSPKQAGFRQHRSTEDQITYIAQEIEDSFQDRSIHSLSG